MEISEKLKDLRTFKNLSTYDLAEKAGIPQSTISKLENGNRKIDTDILQKIADAMDVPIDIFFQKQSPSEILGEPATEEDFKKWDEKSNQLKEETELFETGEFTTPQAAMQFILKQPAIMGFGGFDTNKMTDEEIIEFANELLNLLKMLGPKYNK
ncbi:MAG: helix-turn-helix transcriptional regulator [Clostridium sporogenes]|nr:helix-turn-helix transcriptional regulator [Clostridium sporogenes]